MHDEAHDWTDEQIKDLDRRIHSIYSEASRDIDKKLEDFREKYKVKESIHLQQVKDGKWTQEKFDNWVRGQVFQEKQWEAKRDQIINTITNSNKVASGVINDNMSNVFGYNATYMNYTLEHGAGIDMGFGIYDQNTVAKLIKDNPQALPRYKINEQKDYIWNKKLVNNAITQGIIQGESIDKISKRITDSLCMQNENLSRTFARTAMTEAQNAGRLQSLEDAEEMGIEVHKMWMATLDGRTRDSHRELDGESVPTNEKFSNGLMYPADPSGDPSEVYNCRCTMVGDVKKYPAKFQRRNQEKDKPIQYMTYKQWAKLKEAGKKGYVASEGGKGKTVD
jgi:SPP1 gp7 family putative phage head morphogenesis protein